MKLTFSRDSGERLVVVLRRAELPALLSEVQKKISYGAAVPIDRGSLRIGRMIDVQGWNVGPRPDSEVVLTLFADLTDQGRVVTIPLRLSKAGVADLIQALSLRAAGR